MMMIYVFTHISEGVLRTVKPCEDLELLKKYCIENFEGMNFYPLDDEAEIRNEHNETVFNYNRFHELKEKLEELPFPFHNVVFDRTVSKGDVFKAKMNYTSGRKEEVQILAKYEVDRIEIILKRAGETEGAYYDSIYHI
jgi:hypothetical protein